MVEIEIELLVNGTLHTVRAEPGAVLLAVLRNQLGLLSVKEGCGQGDCGTCVIMMDGLAVNACLVLAGQAAGSTIITLEGLSENDRLHPLQKQFAEKWGFQCGFCTPGMLMSSYALLQENPAPEAAEVRRALEGNLCRCTSYRAIVDAVLAASADLQKADLKKGPSHG